MITKIIKHLFILFALLNSITTLNGQPPAPTRALSPLIPTSPQAEAFQRYGEFAVNHSTGVPDISIPLFEINHRGYTLPLTLKYFPLPLKPGYNYDVYGQGWGLSISSCVSRTIEYIPDEWRDFKLETTKLSSTYYKNIDVMTLNLGYDKFNAVLPDGSSFEFVIENDNGKLEYKVSGNRSVIISCSYNTSNINSFTITDENGIIYSFTGGDTPYTGIGGDLTIYRNSYISWKLSSIKLPNSTEPIVFYYEKSIQSDYGRHMQEATILIKRDYDPSGNSRASAINVQNEQSYFYKMKLLTSIRYGNTAIDFTYQHEAPTAYYNYVKEIRVLDSSVVKKITFDQSVHRLSYPGSMNDSIAKLNTITLSGAVSGTSTEPMVYKCTYGGNGGYFRGTDHWGYLNFYSSDYDVGYFNFFIEFDYQNFSSLTASILKLNKTAQDLCPYEKIRLSRYPSDNRKPCVAGAHGILATLTYPTGGHTEFTFENHRYLSATDYDGNYVHDKNRRVEAAAGGFRIAKIVNYTASKEVAGITHYRYGKVKGASGNSRYQHTGLGEVVADPTILTYMNYTSYRVSTSIRNMILGLSPTGQQMSFTNPFKDLSMLISTWGWECSFSAANFRRVWNGRPVVVYPEVTVYHGDIYKSSPYDPENTSGKTVYEYEIYDVLGLDTFFFERPKYYGNVMSYESKNYKYHVLKRKTDYRAENKEYVLLMTEFNHWFYNYRSGWDYQYTNPYSQGKAPANIMASAFFTGKPFYLGGTRLISRSVSVYPYSNMYNALRYSESFSYNSKNQLVKKTKGFGHIRSIETTYVYPEIKSDGTTTDIIRKMFDMNMIASVIEEKEVHTYKNSVFQGTSGYKKKYKELNIGGSFIILPEELYEITNGSSTSDYMLDSKILTYSPLGNPQTVVGKDGVSVHYLWSYKDRYLIAEIKNATAAQVSAAVSATFGITIEALANLDKPDVLKLKEFRKNTNLANAHVTTFTYAPLIGVTSITDSAGKTIYYDYDALGRLVETYYYEGNMVSSNKKRVIQQYDYHFRNQ